MIITELILAFLLLLLLLLTDLPQVSIYFLVISHLKLNIPDLKFSGFFCVCYPLDLLTFFLSISFGDVVTGFGRIGAERPFALSADRGQVIDQSSLTCMFCFPN